MLLFVRKPYKIHLGMMLREVAANLKMVKNGGKRYMKFSVDWAGPCACACARAVWRVPSRVVRKTGVDGWVFSPDSPRAFRLITGGRWDVMNKAFDLCGRGWALRRVGHGRYVENRRLVNFFTPSFFRYSLRARYVRSCGRGTVPQLCFR